MQPDPRWTVETEQALLLALCTARCNVPETHDREVRKILTALADGGHLMPPGAVRTVEYGWRYEDDPLDIRLCRLDHGPDQTHRDTDQRTRIDWADDGSVLGGSHHIGRWEPIDG